MSQFLSFPNNIAIILIAPQMGENIGAAARVMKNFSVSDLRIVNPRDGWPNEKAYNMAVGAANIIETAKIYSSIKDALKDIEYTYAATAACRNMNKNYVLSHNLIQDINISKKIGIMFGRESSGLNNQEISYANKIITIDTNMEFTSLNIAHSIAVICYELFQITKQQRTDLNCSCELATNDDMEHFYEHLFESLDEKSFFRSKEKKEKLTLKIRNLFARIDNLSKQEVQILRGILTNLTKK